MPRRKKKIIHQNKLPLKDRIRAFRAYKKRRSFDKVALQFKCSAQQIKHIVKEEKKELLKEYINSDEYLVVKRARSAKALKSQCITLVEKTLHEWFQRAQRHTEAGPITNEMLLEKAQEAKEILLKDDFNIDLDWLLKFRQKYDITDLDMSMLRIGNDGDVPPVLEIGEVAEYILDRNGVPLSDLNDIESFSDLEESDFDLDDLSIRTPQSDVQCFNSMDVGSVASERRKTRTVQQIPNKTDVELDMPPISNDEEAVRHLKPLEDYVLMKDNLRGIGIIEQLEKIFNTGNKN